MSEIESKADEGGGPKFIKSEFGAPFSLSNIELRDYFAGHVLMGLCAMGISGNHNVLRMRAEEAYEQADAMLEARKVKP